MIQTDMLKGFGLGILVMAAIATTIYLVYKQFAAKTSNIDIEATTIQKSVEQIAKLMVIESHFSEVYSYQERTKVFFNLIPQEKKALIILNAKAQVGYDLKKIVWKIDKDKKQVSIESLPAEEINITPDLKFYDIQSSTFTSFSSEDLNKVQKDAQDRIREQIEKSDIKGQARVKLVDNLQSIMHVSQALGWTLVDKTNTLTIPVRH